MNNTNLLQTKNPVDSGYNIYQQQQPAHSGGVDALNSSAANNANYNTASHLFGGDSNSNASNYQQPSPDIPNATNLANASHLFGDSAITSVGNQPGNQPSVQTIGHESSSNYSSASHLFGGDSSSNVTNYQQPPPPPSEPINNNTNTNFGNASHLFGGDGNSNHQQSAIQHVEHASSADLFSTPTVQQQNTASQLFAPPQNTVNQQNNEATNPTTSWFSSQPTDETGSTTENKQSSQILQHQNAVELQQQQQQDFSDNVDYYDQPDAGNVQSVEADILQNFAHQESINQPYSPMPDNSISPSDYNQQQLFRQNLSVTNDESEANLSHKETAYMEQTNSFNGQYSANDSQYYEQSHSELHVNTDSKPSMEDNGNDAQSGGSSGSCSSYAMVSSTKSTESESRLSPYQFLESNQYPAQSSFNSNESSPLDVQNMSTASTYEKVSAPSASMSSFDITSGSSEIQPSSLATSENFVQAIEEAAEAIVESPTPQPRPLQPEFNSVLENKKLLQQKAAALFEEAKQINQISSSSSSGPHSMESVSQLFSKYSVHISLFTSS